MGLSFLLNAHHHEHEVHKLKDLTDVVVQDLKKIKAGTRMQERRKVLENVVSCHEELGKLLGKLREDNKDHENAEED